jgi:hypothetical protein
MRLCVSSTTGGEDLQVQEPLSAVPCDLSVPVLQESGRRGLKQAARSQLRSERAAV